MKNPDQCVKYQQAQQQTEEDDLENLINEQDDEITEHDDDENADGDLEDSEVIHL